VIPTRRSTAEAVQILLSHLLGDAGSPFLVGIVRPFVICDFVSFVSTTWLFRKSHLDRLTYRPSKNRLAAPPSAAAPPAVT